MNDISNERCLSEKEKEMTIRDEGNLERLPASDQMKTTLSGAEQSKREKLNRQIFKILRLRDGAEKMMEAMNDPRVKYKKIQDTLRQEINLYDSRLGILYNELANLRCFFHVDESATRTGFPMIAIPLKDTVDIEWQNALEETIANHYHENPEHFREEIESLTELRRRTQNPERSEDGVKILYEYYNQLALLEKRMFTNQVLPGTQFTWFDSLTASRTTNASLVYEKANILFNIAVLWTNIAVKQEFNRERYPAHDPTNALQKAVGIFRFLKSSLRQNFTKDLTSEVLDIFLNISKLESEECAVNLMIREETENIQTYNVLARESAQLSTRYEDLSDSMCEVASIPPAWSTLAKVKSLHFKAASHYYSALIHLENYDPEFMGSDENNATDSKSKRISAVIELNKVATWLMNEECRTDQAKGHLMKAINTERTAVEVASQDRFVNKITCIHKVLNVFTDQIKAMLLSIHSSEDFELIEPADEITLTDSTDEKVKVIEPEFARYKVKDIFARLGPIIVFNSKIKYHPPKTVTLKRDEHGGLGISIRGGAPTVICKLSQKRQHSGIHVGDVIIAIGERTVKCCNHKQVSQFIHETGDSVTLTLMSAVSPYAVLHIL